jgi:phage shock protein A
MAWLSQFTLLMRSSLTSIREQIEDPERMLHQLLIDMQAELDSVRASVAEAVADEILMRKRLERERDEMNKWQERAAVALKRRDDATARTAMEQKVASSNRLQQYEAEHGKQVAEVEKLKSAVRDLEDKIRQAQHKKTLLVARYANAKSTSKIQAAIDRTDSRSAFAQFQRLEDRIDRQEAKIQAWDELDGTKLPSSDIEKEFLEAEQKARIEAELAELRSSLAN